MKINSGQAPSTLIPEYIGSDFDAILTCAENIEYIKNAAGSTGSTGSTGGTGGTGGSGESSPGGYIGDTPPTQPKAGATWYCTLDGRTYTWYEDDDSGQWVESSPQCVTEEAASAVLAHKAEQDAHKIANITGLAAALASIGGGSGGSGGAFGGQYRNLVVTVSGVEYKGTITADRLVVEGADYSTKILRNVNLSFDGANSGVNGLDTGTAAAGNWYYIFAIYNPTTNTSASLISLSMTAPTLPAGYTMAAILGAAYGAAGSIFMPSVKKDFETSLGAGGVQGYVLILNGGSASGMTSVSTVTAAPNISSAINIIAMSDGSGAVYVDKVSTLGVKCSSDSSARIWDAQKQQGVIFYKSFGGLLNIFVIGYRTPF